jgi:hypothetical protein
VTGGAAGGGRKVWSSRVGQSDLRLDAEREGVLERSIAELIEAQGGTYRSTHFASLVTARAAGPRT